MSETGQTGWLLINCWLPDSRIQTTRRPPPLVMSATLDMGANSLIGLEIIVLLRKQCPDLSLQITTGQLAQCYRVAAQEKIKIKLYFSDNLSDRSNNFPNTTQTDRRTAKYSKTLIKDGRCADWISNFKLI